MVDLDAVQSEPLILLGKRITGALCAVKYRYGTVCIHVRGGSPAWSSLLVQELEDDGWRHQPGQSVRGQSRWWRGLSLDEHVAVLIFVMGSAPVITVSSQSVRFSGATTEEQERSLRQMGWRLVEGEWRTANRAEDRYARR
ncbi:MAG: hypothetical protein ACI9MC_002461 [Kiritimatiellia bacterium]